MVLISGLYTNACNDWIKKYIGYQTWMSFKKFFSGKYHDPILTQKFRAGQSGYYIAESVELME